MTYRRRVSKTRSEQSRQRAVIFDFDGTIADSLPAAIQVFEELTKRPERFTGTEIQAFRDLSVPELLKELSVPAWKLPLLLFKGRRMIRAHLRDIELHYGMVPALAALHKRGIPLYILSSNSVENVQSYLKWHKLDAYFRGVYGGASILGKAPRLLKLIDKEHIDVANSWYVGDETRDVSAARAVGLRSISVAWGYNTRLALATKNPDAIVETAKELKIYLERVWKQSKSKN